MEDDDIRSCVKRLSRPDRSGGAVVNRAAILAEGVDAAAVIAWIVAHGGGPEPVKPAVTKDGGGLHRARTSLDAGAAAGAVRRYVLPAGALD